MPTSSDDCDDERTWEEEVLEECDANNEGWTNGYSLLFRISSRSLLPGSVISMYALFILLVRMKPMIEFTIASIYTAITRIEMHYIDASMDQ